MSFLVIGKTLESSSDWLAIEVTLPPMEKTTYLFQLTRRFVIWVISSRKLLVDKKKQRIIKYSSSLAIILNTDFVQMHLLSRAQFGDLRCLTGSLMYTSVCLQILW